MTHVSAIARMLLVSMLAICSAGAQTWQSLTNQPNLPNIGTALLLRDGRVFAHGENTQKWRILTPDSTGNYVNGTWSDAADMPAGDGPFQFSSAVLGDGRVIVEGGEYNGSGKAIWSNMGAIYDPIADQWTAVSPPAGWRTIGDAASVVLFNGTYMQANCCTNQVALFNATNLTWTPTGSTLQQNNNETGWVLLPNGSVMMADGEPACGSNMSTEIYDPNAGTWSCGPQLPMQLWGNDYEMGSGTLMYNNKVLQYGGIVSGTAILDLASNTWSVGPNPAPLHQDDGPSALEPSGKVLSLLAPAAGIQGCQFVEYDPNQNTLTNVANPPECPNLMNSVSGRLLVLPTGQILFTHFSRAVEIYTPTSAVASGVAPTIALFSARITRGSANNLLYGSQLNGLSQANMYGDDVQAATNYPLVQLQDVNTGIVWWARTHNDSSASISRNAISTARYDLNPNMPTGNFSLTVITNGIPSNAIGVQIVDRP